MKTTSFPTYSDKLKTIQEDLSENQSLLIVSKGRTLDEIKAYYDLGHRHFGENKVQELKEKSESLKKDCPDICWHMIGHLQSNKLNQLLEVHHLWAIHSVDDEELLKKLIKSSDKISTGLKVFLQFNTSGEQEKSGFEDYDSLISAAILMLSSPSLKFFGLMTMGTFRTESFEKEAERCFQELNQLKMRLEEDLQVKLMTSMGMSQDYKIALQNNANWIRLGTVMFYP